ncbi:hypothetical protein BPOR_1452g00010 [Botrytis porri]|uniref:Uncharacterized protein n=1 Tax=Botrytis porri TaxID=87229 RepID=A0A4Z1KHQ2_9HELO|nr:hypothetical protein BPOR_1452g00010 [Botrytis porri]
MSRTPRITPISIPALAPVEIPVLDDDDEDAESVSDDTLLEEEVEDATVAEPLPKGDAVEEDIEDEAVLDTQEGSSQALSRFSRYTLPFFTARKT